MLIFARENVLTMTQSSFSAPAVAFLHHLIAIPSISRDEGAAADFIERHLSTVPQVCVHRQGNNVWAHAASGFDPLRPSLMLNAHIDTVRPVSGWTRDPFTPTVEGDRIYGLGANDCGGGLVSLLLVFLHFMRRGGCPHQLLFLASAEEEVSGKDGITSVIPLMPPIDAAIVGEPTSLQPATAEKGLMVIDATARGRAGHAARDEGDNAIYHAIEDIQLLRTFNFGFRTSPLLGPVRLTTTIINAGTQHNVVPDECTFTIDVRTNELYSNRAVFDILSCVLHSELKARSFRLNPSSIPADHPLVRRCIALGLTPFGSPTLSDQALMPWPSLKLGPGESSRSHTADEYVTVTEIARAADLYLRLLSENAPNAVTNRP